MPQDFLNQANAPKDPREEEVADASSATGMFAAPKVPGSGSPSQREPLSPPLVPMASSSSSNNAAESPASSGATPVSSAQRAMPVVREIIIRSAESRDAPPSGAADRGKEASGQPEPGEFTRIFQSLRRPEPADTQATAAPIGPDVSHPHQTPLDISQLLRSIDSRGLTPVAPEASLLEEAKEPQQSQPWVTKPTSTASVASAPPLPRSQGDPESFTEIFKAISSPPSQTQSEPGLQAGFDPQLQASPRGFGTPSARTGSDADSLSQLLKSPVPPATTPPELVDQPFSALNNPGPFSPQGSAPYAQSASQKSSRYPPTDAASSPGTVSQLMDALGRHQPVSPTFDPSSGRASGELTTNDDATKIFTAAPAAAREAEHFGEPAAQAIPLAAPPKPLAQAVQRPVTPQPAMPAPATPAPATPGKLQQYVPFLLILNTFLMLVLLIVLIFALKHR